MYPKKLPKFNKKKRDLAIYSFDPDNNGKAYGGIFGLPFTPETAKLLLIPVPWEVTVSYGSGTATGPVAILEASYQLDLSAVLEPDTWKFGIALDNIPRNLQDLNNQLRPLSEMYINFLENGQLSNTEKEILSKINENCEKLNNSLYQYTKECLKSGRLTALVGGDHSVPFGFIKAIADQHDSFGILQFDAHADLRIAYEGFSWSHASIMYNVISKIPSVKKLVSIGIRDFCNSEIEFKDANSDKIKWFTDDECKSRKFNGENWDSVCKDIIDQLPENVYITFDIDALNPHLCPNTGTPVPGGLEFNEAVYLLKMLVKSGKKIIGFDLCEVSPGNDEWDANVGARMLYVLSSCMISSGQ